MRWLTMSKSIKERIQLINDGREPYLNFLRNLTPQIILLSTVWLASEKFVLPPQLDFTNSFQTITFLALVGCFALAVYANTSRFLDQCFNGYEIWHTKCRRRLAISGFRGVHLNFSMMNAIYRYKFVETVEIFVFFVSITVIALAIVVGMSMHSATRIWNDLHPTTKLNRSIEKTSGQAFKEAPRK